MAKLIASLALTFLTPLVFGQCPLVPGSRFLIGTVTTDETICLPQGPGAYTFGMYTALGGTIPLGPGGREMQEVESAEFLIMDNSCKIFGVFPQPTCGVPYVLEANYLDYVLTLTTISTTTPSGYFSFQYGNGKYSIDNNHCGCSHSAKSTTVYQSYNCAFPVAGQPTNRSIEFEA